MPKQAMIAGSPIQMGEAPYENLLYVQDGEVAIFVGIKNNVRCFPEIAF
jgi:hypothetical protein